MKSPERSPSDRTEQSADGKAALEAFRELAQKKMCKFWTSPKDLGGIVSRSLIKQIKTRPGVGWVRADLVPSEFSAIETLQLKRDGRRLARKIGGIAIDATEGRGEPLTGR